MEMNHVEEEEEEKLSFLLQVDNHLFQFDTLQDNYLVVQM